METSAAFVTWLQTVAISVGVTVATYWGACGLVHHHFYVRRRAEAPLWKLQPNRMPDRKQVQLGLLLGSANILLGAVIGGSFAALHACSAATFAASASRVAASTRSSSATSVNLFGALGRCGSVAALAVPVPRRCPHDRAGRPQRP
jgi:hypothetical protein